MFKIARLESTNNEKINVDFINYESNNFITKINESFKTLSFDIMGTINDQKYTFSFDLNRRPIDLLNIKEFETVDFKDYLFESETYFTLNETAYMEPLYEIKICRWLKNIFIISIRFYSESYTKKDNIYSGMIEFEFDLNKYIKEEKNMNISEKKCI